MSSSIIEVNMPSPRTTQVSTSEVVFDAGMDHQEWPPLNPSKIDNSSIINTDNTTPGVNTSTESDWELLPPGEVPSSTSTTMASTMKRISVPTPTSRPKRSQTIGTEQEALAMTTKTTTQLHPRPVLKHCQSSPDLRHSFYEFENVAESSDSAADDGSDEDSGSAVMIENDSSDDDDDDEASSSVILVSGPPSVVTAATSTSVWSAATPAAPKLSFAAALATQSATNSGGDAQPLSQQQQHYQQHHHRRRHNKLKKSKIVVVTPTMKRNSKSMGDLKSLGRILEQQEEEERRRERFGRHKFPLHFYPRALGEGQVYDDDGLIDVGEFGGGDYRGAMSHEEVLGETDAQEFYKRKETGKLGRENGLKSRPDEAKRLDIILAKKELQREQQKKGQQKPKQAAEKKKPSGGGGGKGRTRW